MVRVPLSSSLYLANWRQSTIHRGFIDVNVTNCTMNAFRINNINYVSRLCNSRNMTPSLRVFMYNRIAQREMCVQFARKCHLDERILNYVYIMTSITIKVLWVVSMINKVINDAQQCLHITISRKRAVNLILVNCRSFQPRYTIDKTRLTK